ncbi:MAG: geranylgeranyl reductase family protein [Bacteroidales bacterium]|nr:geranylgeranyl reductase family protein [Bacteroidales bacterium]
MKIINRKSSVINYDVIIIGAGPAGITCALALKDAGLNVAIIDKEKFPRDKVCGDAIPHTVPKVLHSISPSFNYKFKGFNKKNIIRGYKIVAPNSNFYEVFYKGSYYNSKRRDFDFQLFQMVQENTSTTFYQQIYVQDITQNKDYLEIKTKNSNLTFHAQIVIGADGAHSVVAKKLTNNITERKLNCAAVRSYYKNIKGVKSDVSEIYLLKNYLPGYFWIFPLQNNVANVGFGLTSKIVSEQRINLKKIFNDIITTSPLLAERFSNATQVGNLSGYDLPMSSGTVKVSGYRYMLAGDAASLIDPVTGTGIGNAMISGKLAADQVIDCFVNDRFNENYIKNYDYQISSRIRKGLNQRYFLQKIMGKKEWFINFAISAAAKNKSLTELIRNYV